MSKASSKVRLASEPNVGATTYNMYQLMTQLLSLYAVAAETESEPYKHRDWEEIRDSALEDLALLCSIWDQLIGKERDLARQPTPEIAPLVKRTCERVERVYGEFNHWLGMRRYAIFLGRVERIVARVLVTLGPQLGPFAAMMEQVNKGNTTRSQLLEKLNHDYGQTENELNVRLAQSKSA